MHFESSLHLFPILMRTNLNDINFTIAHYFDIQIADNPRGNFFLLIVWFGDTGSPATHHVHSTHDNHGSLPGKSSMLGGPPLLPTDIESVRLQPVSGRAGPPPAPGRRAPSASMRVKSAQSVDSREADAPPGIGFSDMHASTPGYE